MQGELAKRDLLVSMPTAKLPCGWIFSVAWEWNEVLALSNPRAGQCPREWEPRRKTPLIALSLKAQPGEVEGQS